MHRCDRAVGIGIIACAFNHKAMTQAHFVADKQTEKAFHRLCHKVVLLYPQLTREFKCTLSHLWVVRVNRCVALLGLPRRIVVNDEFERLQHTDRARGFDIQIIAHRLLEHTHVYPRIGFGHANAFGKQAQTLRRKATAANAHQCHHAWIVPAIDVILLDQLQQFAFAGNRVGEVQTGKFGLLRQRLGKHADLNQSLQNPVVQRAVVFKFERAQ